MKQIRSSRNSSRKNRKRHNKHSKKYSQEKFTRRYSKELKMLGAVGALSALAAGGYYYYKNRNNVTKINLQPNDILDYKNKPLFIQDFIQYASSCIPNNEIDYKDIYTNKYILEKDPTIIIKQFILKKLIDTKCNNSVGLVQRYVVPYYTGFIGSLSNLTMNFDGIRSLKNSNVRDLTAVFANVYENNILLQNNKISFDVYTNRNLLRIDLNNLDDKTSLQKKCYENILSIYQQYFPSGNIQIYLSASREIYLLAT